MNDVFLSIWLGKLKKKKQSATITKIILINGCNQTDNTCFFVNIYYYLNRENLIIFMSLIETSVLWMAHLLAQGDNFHPF